MVFLWFTYGLPMVYLWFSYGLPMVYLWFSYGFPMVYLWFSYGLPMVYLWFTGYIPSFTGGGVASQAPGATLSAAMCGGALELLLLGTACGEALLRACAFEAEKHGENMGKTWKHLGFLVI